MLNRGTLAIALVQRQVMVVQAARSHTQRDRWLDVYTFAPFGERVFLATDVPAARIAHNDVLSIFPISDRAHALAAGMLELPPQAFSEFVELSSRNQARFEGLWAAQWADSR